MNRTVSLIGLVSLVTALGSCGSDGPKDPLWPLESQPECEGAQVVPLSGSHPMVISALEIGDLEDGFDLDLDGEPDNKLAAVGSLARSSIDDSFEKFDIVIPFEFFDFETPAADECVKFAIYLGQYKQDADDDGDTTADDKGDCNDHDKDIHKNTPEIAGNFKDDDCDGYADEADVEGDGGITVVFSDDTMDRDGDGVTIADGDCDDTVATGATVGGVAEICGDGLDNDCDGNADYGLDVDSNPVCTPYDDTPDMIALDPLGFNPDGTPLIAFTAGTVVGGAGALFLEAGPSVFSVNIPVTEDLSLDLRISGARIEGNIVMTPAGYALVDARLGGVIDAHTADKITGLEVEEIGLTAEDSLLDAVFANILGPILALPSIPDEGEFAGCRTPDIDVDQDGLEAFCDSDLLDDVSHVDVCIDGNGKVFRDEMVDGVLVNCTEVRDAKGQLRFVDGISVEINFDSVPTLLPSSLPPL